MDEGAYDRIWDLDWVEIPGSPYIMKCGLHEDGYTLMVSDLAAVYGEILDVEAIEERFQILNPFVEMLPEVILKHVKQLLEKMYAGEAAYEDTELNITRDSNILTIQQKIIISSGICFIYNFAAERLPENQFRAHIFRPTLLRALILNEEKGALQRKVEELEGRQSSSRSSKRRSIKAVYSEFKESDSPGLGILHTFLYLQNEQITLPESLQGTPNVSPMKGMHSSSANSFSEKRTRDSKKTARNISYEEGDSEAIFESQNRIQQTKESQISIKTEKNEEDESNMGEFDNSVSNLSAKGNGEQSNRLSPIKREMAEEDNKEESVSKHPPYLKPSPSKRKKILKF